jgi:hypothetical protein
MNTPELRERGAAELSVRAAKIKELTAFIGLDGFMDEICHAVDQRTDADNYRRLPTIASFAARVTGAAGQSANLELVSVLTKLGGSGPITANALAHLGLRVTCAGAFGFPVLHPFFNSFAERVELHSIASPGHTHALEFEDGKIMLNQLESFKEVSWENIQQRVGRERFAAKFGGADLVGFLNWTMLSRMSEIWEALLRELCPRLSGPRRKLMFDLCDPEKRSRPDLRHALELIGRFEKYFDVILGLNEKEAHQIGAVLDIAPPDRTRDGLRRLAAGIQGRLAVNTVVIHPVACAVAAGADGVALVEGPYTARPVITTGAGDHFNAGFCLGKLLGLDDELSLLYGVTTSGHYVRTGQSPDINDLTTRLRNWPADN